MSRSEFEFEGKKNYQGKNAEENGHYNTAMKIHLHAKKDPYKAKRLAKYIKENPEWTDKKEKVMNEILEAKFSQNAQLKRKLKETGDTKLCDRTSDGYWGCGTPLTNQNQFR